MVEGYQRGGFGQRLFETMLQSEGVQAERLGYDRPSPKLINFLRKHFGLVQYQPQANHFVVFDKYWTQPMRRSSLASGGSFARLSKLPQPAPYVPKVQQDVLRPQPYNPAKAEDVSQNMVHHKGPVPTRSSATVPPFACFGSFDSDAKSWSQAPRALPALPRQTRRLSGAPESPFQRAGQSTLGSVSLVAAMAQGRL